MSYQRLKESSLPVLNQKESTDSALEISQEDIDSIKKATYNIGIYPFTGLAISGLVVLALKNLFRPGFGGNPLVPEERLYYRRKYFNFFMSRQLLFIGALGGFCYGFVKYELTKYYLSLKYRRLVNAFVDANDENYYHQLQHVGKAIEIDLQQSKKFKKN